MSERGDLILEQQRQADERLRQANAVNKRIAHGGPGYQVRCQSCARRYRAVGQGSLIPDCPYCGAEQKEEDQH